MAPVCPARRPPARCRDPSQPVSGNDHEHEAGVWREAVQPDGTLRHEAATPLFCRSSRPVEPTVGDLAGERSRRRHAERQTGPMWLQAERGSDAAEASDQGYRPGAYSWGAKGEAGVLSNRPGVRTRAFFAGRIDGVEVSSSRELGTHVVSSAGVVR
jgi:hypothetical protein